MLFTLLRQVEGRITSAGVSHTRVMGLAKIAEIMARVVQRFGGEAACRATACAESQLAARTTFASRIFGDFTPGLEDIEELGMRVELGNCLPNESYFVNCSEMVLTGTRTLQ